MDALPSGTNVLDSDIKSEREVQELDLDELSFDNRDDDDKLIVDKKESKFRTEQFGDKLSIQEIQEITLTKADQKVPSYKFNKNNYIWNGLRNVLAIVQPGRNIDLLIYKQNLIEAFDNVYIDENHDLE